MKKLLKPFKRHSREVDEGEVPRRSRSEVRTPRKSESGDHHVVDSSHNTPIRPSTAAIAPAHPAVAVNGSGAFMNEKDLITNNEPRQSRTSKVGGDEKYMTEPPQGRFSEDVADRNLPGSLSEKVANGSANGHARGSTDLTRKAVPSSVDRQRAAVPVATPPTSARMTSTEAVSGARAAMASANGHAAKQSPRETMDRQPTELAAPSLGAAPSRYSTAETDVPATALPIRAASTKKLPELPAVTERDATVPVVDDSQRAPLSGVKAASAAPAVQPPHQEFGLLPKIPLTEPLFASQTDRAHPFIPDDTPIHAPAIKRLPTDLHLPEGFSLQDSVDVDRSTTHAPAVTHEVIQPTVHHIRHEIITREIHNHDVYHRILPVVDVRILPARHYILDHLNDFKLKEVPACCVPGRTNDEHRSWTILETCSRFPELWDKDRKAPAERVGSRFTARTFTGKEGDTIEWAGKDGVKRSERTWVHPPVSSAWGMEHGGTEPLYLDDFAGSQEIKYDYHVNGVLPQHMTVFDPSSVHDHSFEETPELRHINGDDVIADCTATHNPVSRPATVQRDSQRERLRLVDESFSDNHPTSSRIETANAGQVGIAI